LDDRPQARTQFRPAAAVSGSFTAVEVAELYGVPAGLDGTGETIAFLELGGGYREADLEAYFQGLGLPTPSVVSVSVDHGANRPGADADAEVMLDLEVAGAVAPKASLVVYFAPNTDRGFLDAVTTAVHDTTHRPSLLS